MRLAVTNRDLLLSFYLTTHMASHHAYGVLFVINIPTYLPAWSFVL